MQAAIFIQLSQQMSNSLLLAILEENGNKVLGS
jgi:hypothetical protein